MRLQYPVTIIGWGDTPTEERFCVDNSRVLQLIENNLIPLAETALGPISERFKHDLSKIRAHNQQTVTEKFGIASRQYTSTDSFQLAFQAAQRAIKYAIEHDPCFSVEKIELVISGGSTPDDLYPSCAARLQYALGIPDAEAYDISVACASGTQALIEGVRALQVNPNMYVLVAIGESIGSRCNDLMDENALLWGDGGSAIILRCNQGMNRNYGIQSFISRADGSLAGTTRSRGIGTHPDHRLFPALNASMEGRGPEIYEWVIGPVAKKLKQFLIDTKFTITNNTFLIPHNGNLRMITRLGKSIGVPPERILNRIAERGNQSSASVFSTLAKFADQKDFFQHNDQLIFATFGGGVVYNFVTYRWE